MEEFYKDPGQARDLAARYNALSFEDVHKCWRKHWPAKGLRVLDIGAGSGRDALWFAKQECEVFAVEPSDALRELGMQHTKGHDVTWLSDELPALKHIIALGIRFDLILISAVWMHIPRGQRDRAMRKLSSLLSVNGKLVITLRHGGFDDGRVSYDVSVREIQIIAERNGLKLILSSQQQDCMSRMNVLWEVAICGSAHV